MKVKVENLEEPKSRFARLLGFIRSFRIRRREFAREIAPEPLAAQETELCPVITIPFRGKYTHRTHRLARTTAEPRHRCPVMRDPFNFHARL
jgi:hypothetical protein